MGGLQIRSCSNCRFFDKYVLEKPWFECWGSDGTNVCPDWKSRRGAKAGSNPKPGDKKTGPKKFKDRTLLRQYVHLSFTEKDILKAGGIEKVKEYLTKKFYDKIKGL